MIDKKEYLNVSHLEKGDIIEDKSLNLMGEITMSVLNILLNFEFDYLDISEAKFDFAYEPHWTCRGWSHHGPIESVSYQKVEMLRVFLENIRAKTIMLPDDIMQRHINSAKLNEDIHELKVSDNCPIFAYEDGKLMNKKKTKPVFGCKAYTVTGEIRGEWDTFQPKVDIILNDKEVELIKKLVSESETDNFLFILMNKMPKLYEFLHDYFYKLAWKQVVSDGMKYLNLSRREAEKAEMSGNEYMVFVPEEFKEVK